MRDSIQMLFFEKAYTAKRIPFAYSFKPHPSEVKGWLQRKAWAWLRRSGAVVDAYDMDEKYEAVTVAFDDILEAVLTARHQVYERTGRAPTRLVMGAEAFNEIMGSPSLRASCSYVSLSSHKAKLMGMDMEIVPWMAGWVVLP